MNKTIVILVTILMAFSACARYHKVSSEESFYKRITRKKFAVVLLYAQTKQQRKDKKQRKQFKELINMFRSLESRKIYRKADVLFMSGNVVDGKLDDIVSELQIGAFPTYILYQDGIVYRKNGKPAIMSGYISRDQLARFIDGNLHEQMEKYIKKKAEERRLRALESSYYWGGPYYPWGWYYPYSNYYYPYRYRYGYPGFGFGLYI